MSKACRSLEEVEATREHYRQKDGTEVEHIAKPDGTYAVYRKSDNKTLKSVGYSKADLAPIVAAAQRAGQG